MFNWLTGIRLRIRAKAVFHVKVTNAAFEEQYAVINGCPVTAMLDPTLNIDASVLLRIICLTLSCDKKNYARMLTVIISSKSSGDVLMMLPLSVFDSKLAATSIVPKISSVLQITDLQSSTLTRPALKKATGPLVSLWIALATFTVFLNVSTARENTRRCRSVEGAHNCCTKSLASTSDDTSFLSIQFILRPLNLFLSTIRKLLSYSATIVRPKIPWWEMLFEHVWKLA